MEETQGKLYTESEVAALKGKIGGYKKHNEVYREQLAQSAEKIKNLEIGQELLASTVDRLEAEKKALLEEKRKLSSDNQCLQMEVDSLKNWLHFYKTNYDYFVELPWWKRLFFSTNNETKPE